MKENCSASMKPKVLMATMIILVMSGLTQSPSAYQPDIYDGWAVEPAIPLASFGIDPAPGAVIGLNVQLNDDDDGGNHDHKLSWSKAEPKGNNASFSDPSIFGELRLSYAGSAEEEERMGTEEKAKIIEGVDRLKWGNGMESTFIGALTVAMRSIGEDISYDYLMGVSGAAFRLHFHQPGWCPSSPDATCGYDHSGPALRALGYTARPIHSDKNKPEEVKEVRDAVVQSIDDGRPVVAIDLIGSPDWGVIAGYSEGGKEFICRTYYDKTEEYSRTQKWPWVTMIIEEKKDTPSRRESVLQSLKIAQEIANTEKYEDYASGFSAYESWIADLLDDSRYENIDEEELGGMVHVNAWCYNSLGDARSSAVKYLRSVAGDFGEEGEAHLTKAADIYDKIMQKLMGGWKYAPFPHQLKDGERWTKEMRHAEADVLKEVLALEREAVDELKAAYDKEKGRMEKLDKLDFAPRATSHMGALEGCLKYLGIDVSPGWLYGSTGHAFILNIGDDLCGSGPHSWSWGVVNQLGKNIGYKTEVIYTNINKDDFSQMQEKAWTFARKSVDDGFPCYGWHYDFMVINGYDDNGYLLSGPVDDAPGDWRKFGAEAVGFLEIWSIRPGQKADDETTIKAALSFAADMAKEPDKRSLDPGTGGLSGYDNWIKGLESGEGDAFGGAYNTAIWSECRRFAVEFLAEANQRTGKEYDNLFQPAIEQYKLVSDNLNEVEKLFPYKSATEEEWKRNMEDSQRRQKAVEHLKAAKAAEVTGLELLGKIVAAL